MASSLKVRKIDFEFPVDIPFQAFPNNPEWGNFVNLITLIAPAFERYFIKSIRLAIPEITDPSIKAEAEDFCAQEAQHSRHHLAHLDVLARHYPGLLETEKAIKASYQSLFESETQAFHLGYAASVELTFGPIAKFAIENRNKLFSGGDARIASFLMWHLVEEFEHRNAAIDVYKHVIGSYWFRLKTIFKVFRHIFEVYDIAMRGILEHVYEGDSKNMPMPHKAFKPIPLHSKLEFYYQLLCTILPYHNPDNLKQPDWVTQWFRDEAQGVDMRSYFKS